ncbi:MULTISPECIES: hypothetical protein [Bradyrhizobium]|uniref:hypothetical protein n=1 Tax=Bradyrhizobium TaxID=374 RepID=UPI001EDC7FCE|nr:hypothetical protein [Bradyrhizobium zhengyangense]MCG2642450.1 hypothetical protein [Bradyrhizobium zhengyangense]
MSKKSQTTPANHTRSAQQLADLATLLGLMQAASKLSQDLDTLANQVGGSLETIAERFGVPFFEVHQTFADQQRAKRKPKAMTTKKVREPASPR